MTDITSGNGSAGDSQAAGPRLSILTQYVKDLSFENPRAPLGLQPGQARPEIQIQVDVQARQLGEEQYEVMLELSANAKTGEHFVTIMSSAHNKISCCINSFWNLATTKLFIKCRRKQAS